jgi:hypothetical protein
MDKTKLPCRSVSQEDNLLQELWEDGVTSQIAVQHMITFDPNMDAAEPVLTTYKKSVDQKKFMDICTKYGLNPDSINQINEFEYHEVDGGPAYKHVHVYPDDGPYNPVSEDNDVVVVCINRQTGGLKEKTSGPVLD